MDEITNQRNTELVTPEPLPDNHQFATLSQDEKLEAIYALVSATNDSQRATQAMVEGVIAEVGPMVESFANNPALKMLGFGKKFGL